MILKKEILKSQTVTKCDTIHEIISEQNQKGVRNEKAVCAGWESIAKVENNGWISIDNPPPHSDRYLCQIKLKNEGVKTEIHYLCHNNNEYNKEVLGVTHCQYLPDEAENKNE